MTPLTIRGFFTRVASRLEELGYTLRSGAAKGADVAFESGVSNSSSKQIFIPWNGFVGDPADPSSPRRYHGVDGALLVQENLIPEATRIASRFYPEWKRLGVERRALLLRDVPQVLGPDLRTPTDFVLCWAIVDGKRDTVRGGTRMAYELARRMNIPTFNVAVPADQAAFWANFGMRPTAR